MNYPKKRLLFIGEDNSGKTSILNHIINSSFTENIPKTNSNVNTGYCLFYTLFQYFQYKIETDANGTQYRCKNALESISNYVIEIVDTVNCSTMQSLKAILSSLQESSSLAPSSSEPVTPSATVRTIATGSCSFPFDCVFIVYSYEPSINKDKLFSSLFSQYTYIKSLNENALIYFVCNKYPFFVHKNFSYESSPSDIVIKEILEYKPEVIDLLKKYSKRGKVKVNNKEIEIKTNGKQITFFCNCLLGIGIDYMMNYVLNEIVDKDHNFLLSFRESLITKKNDTYDSLTTMIFNMDGIDKSIKNNKTIGKKEKKRFFLNCCGKNTIENDDEEDEYEKDYDSCIHEKEYEDEGIRSQSCKKNTENKSYYTQEQDKKSVITMHDFFFDDMSNEYKNNNCNDYDIGIHIINKVNKISNEKQYFPKSSQKIPSSRTNTQTTPIQLKEPKEEKGCIII